MNFEIIDSLAKMGNFVSDLSTVDEIAMDLEASGLDELTCKPYSIQINTGHCIYVFDLLKFPKLSYIAGLIANKKIVGINLKYDIKVIYANTHIMLENVFDTMFAEVLLHKGIGKNYYSYEEMVEKYFHFQLDKTVRESFYKNGELTSLTYEQLLYAAMDVFHLLDLKKLQEKDIEDSKQTKILDLENRLLPVVAKMELNGVPFDREHWTRLMVEANEKANEISIKIKKEIINRIDRSKYSDMLALCSALKIPVTTKKKRLELSEIKDLTFCDVFLEEHINIGSPTQMLEILNLLGFKVESTGEKVLAELHSNDPLIKMILEFREYSKKGAAFGESFLEKVHPVTGRIHSDFYQLATDSGRFSSSKPNMQQIIRDSEYRHCFKADPGWKIITTDYSQQELRIAGALSGEPLLINAYKNGIDVHSLTASILFEVPVEKVTKEQRTIAKTYNFAVLYGTTEYGLAYNFGFEIKYAKELLKKFLAGYEVMADFKTAVEEQIVKHHYSVTATGRKRFFEERVLYTDRREIDKIESQMKRMGFNHVIQGTGADIVKIALCNIYYLNPFGEDLKIILTVHDEIVVEVREAIAKEAQDFIVKCMLDAEQPYLGDIKAEASSVIDDTWSK